MALVRLSVILAGAALVTATAAGCGGSNKSDLDVQSTAQGMANEDHADPAPYIAALTTLNRLCAQDPLSIETDDVHIAQKILSDGGAPASDLAVLQAMVKVAEANPNKTDQDCQGIAKAVTSGVLSQHTATP